MFSVGKELGLLRVNRKAGGAVTKNRFQSTTEDQAERRCLRMTGQFALADQGGRNPPTHNGDFR